MESQRKPQTAPVHAQRFDQVMRWPGLRGEPKLAWWTLYYTTAGCRLTTIDVHPASIAVAQGTKERSGVRALEALARAGLIEIIDRKVIWKIFLNDPLEVATARPGPKSDGQSELFDVDVDEPADELEIFPVDQRATDTPKTRLRSAVVVPQPPADVAPHPPTRARADLRPQEINLYQTSDLRPRRESSRGEKVRSQEVWGGGSGATSAERSAAGSGQPTEPKSMAAMLANFAAPSLADTAAEIERLAAWIESQAPELYAKQRLAAATAVVEGTYPLAALQRLLAQFRQQKARREIKIQPGAYLSIALGRSMRENDRRTR